MIFWAAVGPLPAADQIEEFEKLHFEDGPPPTGLRYCINGVALNFEPEAK